MNIQIEEGTLSLLILSLQLTGEKELMSERLFSAHDCSETVTKKQSLIIISHTVCQDGCVPLPVQLDVQKVRSQDNSRRTETTVERDLQHDRKAHQSAAAAFATPETSDHAQDIANIASHLLGKAKCIQVVLASLARQTDTWLTGAIECCFAWNEMSILLFFLEQQPKCLWFFKGFHQS